MALEQCTASFNGAALLRARKPDPHSRAESVSSSFNGAALLRARKLPKSDWIEGPYTQLQRGRAFEGAETVAPRLSIRRHWNASTGPRF